MQIGPNDLVHLVSCIREITMDLWLIDAIRHVGKRFGIFVAGLRFAAREIDGAPV